MRWVSSRIKSRDTHGCTDPGGRRKDVRLAWPRAHDYTVSSLKSVVQRGVMDGGAKACEATD